MAYEADKTTHSQTDSSWEVRVLARCSALRRAQASQPARRWCRTTGQTLPQPGARGRAIRGTPGRHRVICAGSVRTPCSDGGRTLLVASRGGCPPLGAQARGARRHRTADWALAWRRRRRPWRWAGAWWLSRTEAQREWRAAHGNGPAVPGAAGGSRDTGPAPETGDSETDFQVATWNVGHSSTLY